MLPQKHAATQTERDKSYKYLRAIQYFLIPVIIIKSIAPSYQGFSYTFKRGSFGRRLTPALETSTVRIYIYLYFSLINTNASAEADVEQNCGKKLNSVLLT